jgi:acyl-CoA reductase-like NAD-dependent aldehyde dehydrogenase
MASAPEQAQLGYTSIEEIGKINESLRKTFLTGKTRDLEYRKNQLKQLTFLLTENRKDFIDALKKDLGRPTFETEFAEMQAMINDCVEAVDHLDKWAAPEKKWAGMSFATHKLELRKEPKGTVLVLGAWNYPLTVQIGPVIAAISAGNTYVLKPSEVAAHTAKLIGELWPQYMDPDTGRIVNGGIPQSTALLDLRWEHIFYTGNGTVGRIVSEKASKWLCPVTLELGGKSPTWVDEHTNLSIAAHRIIWAKTINNGQTCIAPDYIVCPASFQSKLVAELRKVIDEFYPSAKGGVQKSDSYARIINEGHWKRIDGLVQKSNGKIAIGGRGGQEKQKFMPPTIVTDCKPDDSLMTGEIFGPILPILPVRDVDEAISFINSRDQPLALYIFSNDSTAKKIIDNTRSGGVVVGDLLLQFAITVLPFGGTGPSGHGNYHGEYGFRTFSHERATVYAPDKGIMGAIVEKVMSPRYPPYGKGAVAHFNRVIGKPVRFSKPKNPHASRPAVSEL